MYCSYCGSKLAQRPDSGTCPHCGGPLPQQTQQPQYSQPSQTFQQPTVIYQVQQPVYQIPLQRGVNCCGRCLSPSLSVRKKGFNWGYALLGFFFLPVFGLLFGYCGSKKNVYTCRNCGFTWTR